MLLRSMLTLHQHLVLYSEGELVQYDTVKRCIPGQCYLKPIVAQKSALQLVGTHSIIPF